MAGETTRRAAFSHDAKKRAPPRNGCDGEGETTALSIHLAEDRVERADLHYQVGDERAGGHAFERL